MKRLLLLATLVGFLLSGCNLSAAGSPAPTPNRVLVTRDPNATITPTPFRPLAWTPSATLFPSPTVTLTPSLTNTPLPTSTVTPAPPTATMAPSNRAKYDLEVVFNYAERSLSVKQTIKYPNQTGQSLDDVLMVVEPNRWDGCFDLHALSVSSDLAKSYKVEGKQLSLDLARPLNPGETMLVSMEYDLCVPYKTVDAIFGYNGYQINLVDWYPYIVPFQSGMGWLVHNPSGVGEHQVYDSVDFEVNLRFVDEKPPVVAAGAPAEPNGEWARYRMNGTRNFVFSASPDYIVSTTNSGNTVINSYYFSHHQSGGRGILTEAVNALNIFGVTFAPYPYTSLSIVETDYFDGMEFSGLVFLSDDFYAEYNGTPRGNLIPIGVHEIAHQWFYSLVGNDQALEPWLDEALSVYAERIFYETYYPGSLGWWWNFRVKYFNPSGWVDGTIYNSGGFRAYTDAIYLRGALFIEELRARIGDEALFAFLNDYSSRSAYERATKDTFFEILDSHTDRSYADIIQNYFMESP